MYFNTTFPRNSSAVHALRPSLWTIFLLSSAMCFLVSSYTIDVTCRNYEGSDITVDIESAVTEMQGMINNAYSSSLVPVQTIIDLLVSLFGPDHETQSMILAGHFSTLFGPPVTELDYVIICDDQSVELQQDLYQNPPDPLGIWIDYRHGWAAKALDFAPCDATRDFAAPARDMRSYTIANRFIYLCPSVLDHPKGRSNMLHKDQDLETEWIDDYMLLPVILLHEIIRLRLDDCKPSISWSPFYDWLPLV